MRYGSFTLKQIAKVRKENKLKKFKKDKADVSGSKNRRKKGYFCPSK